MKKLLVAVATAVALSACGPAPYNPALTYTGMAEIKRLDRVAKSSCMATVRLWNNNQIGSVQVGRGHECTSGRFKIGQHIPLIAGSYRQ